MTITEFDFKVTVKVSIFYLIVLVLLSRNTKDSCRFHVRIYNSQNRILLLFVGTVIIFHHIKFCVYSRIINNNLEYHCVITFS